MVSPSPGLGANDPQSNRRTAGLGIPGSASIGGLSGGGSFSADTSGLKDLRKELQGIVGDITALDKAVKALSTSLTANSSRWSSFKSALGGGSGAGGGGSPSLSAAGFSAPPGGGTPTPGGAGTSGGAGPGGPNNSSAPVSFNGGKTLALGAMAEVGAGWAGTINNKIASFQSGGTAINQLAGQASSIYGGTSTGTNLGLNSLSQADMAKALAMLQQNTKLSSAYGSKNFNKVKGFLNSATLLNPSMGAAGGMSFANDMSANNTMNFLQRMGQGSNGLVNIKTGNINNTNTAFKSVLTALNGGRPMSAAQAKFDATHNPKWTSIVQNAQANTSLTPQDMVALQQYAAKGMNLNAAEKAMGNTAAAHALYRSTQATDTKQVTYQKQVGVNNWINSVKGWGSHALRDVENLPGAGVVVGGGVLAAHGVAGVAKGAGHLAEIDLMLKGLKTLIGGKGLSNTGGGPGGGGGTQSSPTSVVGTKGGAGAIVVIGTGPNGVVPVSIAGSSGHSTSSHSASGHSTTTPSSHSSKAKPGWGIVGDLYRRWQKGSKDQSKAPSWQNPMNLLDKIPLIKDLPGPLKGIFGDGIGDPITGSTTTQGLDPAMKKRMSAMMAANPSLKINSGHRTAKQQAALYALKGGKGVASPGHSQHQLGKAADVGPPSQYGWIAKNASKYGLGRPDAGEPWHLQAMGDPSSSSASVTGGQVVTKAETWIGTNYAFGGNGTSPGQDVDCSRFVQEVYQSLGIQLPRTTYDQVKVGTAVNGLGSAQPGDLIFYAGSDGTPSNPGHVAIYIGGGKQIAAPHTGTKVQIQNVSAGSVVAIRRIVGGGAGKSVADAAAAAAGVTSSSDSSWMGGGGATTSLENTFASQVSSAGGWLGSTGAGTGSSSTSSGSTPPSAGAISAASSTASKGSLTANQVYQLALSAGLSPAAARMATGVADVESRFNPSAIDKDSNGTTDYGLWQINTVNGGSSALNNPAAAAAKMASMTNKGTAWHAWGPDFGLPGYSVNPSGPGGKVAAALAQLGTLGDPAPSFSPSTGGASTGSSMVSASGLSKSGRSITINMPVQVVGVSQQDAMNLAQMVIQMIRSDGEMSSVSGG